MLGPGENAGAVAVGDGLACAFKVESHNHPSAVEPFQGAATGVGRHPARRLRGRRPADRRAGLAALRRARRVAARPLPARARRRGHRALRQLDRRPDGRRRALLRGQLRAELPRERHVPRADRDRAADPLGRRGGRQRRGALRRPHRPRRHRRRLGAGQRRARRRRRGQAPERPDRRPVRGEPAAGVLARAARRGPAGRAAGPRGGGADLLLGGDGGQGRGRDRPRRAARAAARGGDGALRDHDLGVPGADALRGRAGSAGRGAGRLRALAGQRDGDRRGDRDAAAARVRRRGAGGRDARARAGRRVPGLRARALAAGGRAVPGAAAGARPGERPARDAARAAGRREPRLPPLGVRAVRLRGGVAHRAPAGRGRRGGAAAGSFGFSRR